MGALSGKYLEQYEKVKFISEEQKEVVKTKPIDFQEKISIKIYKQLLSFLTLKDVYNLSMTCKKMRDFQQLHQPPYGLYLYRNFLQQQINSSLELQYLEHPCILQQREVIVLGLLNDTQQQWFQLLRDLINLKLQFNAQKQTSYLEFLIEPQTPKLILKRETVGIHCVTDHQNMLAMRLELESKGIDKLFDAQLLSQKLMKYMRDNKQQLIEESINQASILDKENFFKLRWFLQGTQQMNQCAPFLLRQLDLFIRSIDLYTKSVSMILQEYINQNQVSAYSLLLDYCQYWQTYSDSILEIEQTLIPFEQILNELYQEMFPNHPQFPKFSFWRLMVKKWLENIFSINQLSNILEETYLKLVRMRRNQIMMVEFKEVEPKEDELFIPQLDHITHELYDNFVRRKRHSAPCHYDIETDHPFFNSNYQEVDLLLQRYFQFLQDLSLSEVSIHWVGHTDCTYEFPFQDLVARFIQETSNYYEQQKFVFQENFEQYIKFLNWDAEYIVTISHAPLVRKIKQLQKEHLFTQICIYFQETVIQNFLKEQSSFVAKLFHSHNTEGTTQSVTPNRNRTSMTSSNNEQNENTIGDDEEAKEQQATQIFNFFMENPYVDIQDLMIKERLKQDPDPLGDIIKVGIQEQYPIIEQAIVEYKFTLIDQFEDYDNDNVLLSTATSNIFQSQISQFQPLKQRVGRSYSQIKRQKQSIDIPDELIKILKQKILENDTNHRIVSSFGTFCLEFERDYIDSYQKNQEIENLNNSREIPKELPPDIQEFYNITSRLRAEKILSYVVEQQPQVEEEEKQGYDPEEHELMNNYAVLSKSSSKLYQKQSELMEEYNSEGEDYEDFFEPPNLSKK